MSKASAEAFLDALERDEGLRRQLMALGQKSAAYLAVAGQRLADLGAERGYSFSASEIATACGQRAGRSRELTESDLESVAGGVGAGAFPIKWLNPGSAAKKGSKHDTMELEEIHFTFDKIA